MEANVHSFETHPHRVMEFVNHLIAAGCDMVAIGNGYCLDEPKDGARWEYVRAILVQFGPRDHLKPEIVAYLRRLGRVVHLG